MHALTLTLSNISSLSLSHTPFTIFSGPFSVLFSTRPEPAVGVPPEEVQEQQRLAEAVGGLHQLLPVLLQDPPGQSSMLCSHCSVISRPHLIIEQPLITLTHECEVSVVWAYCRGSACRLLFVIQSFRTVVLHCGYANPYGHFGVLQGLVRNCIKEEKVNYN